MGIHGCISLALATMLWLSAVACERQGPPPKPVGAATNKHVEDTRTRPSRPGSDAMLQPLQKPMEAARQTEDVLKQSADRSRHPDETP